jgi:hypothetical protein
MQRCRAMKISSRELTTCHVADDGSKVNLEFLDQSGMPVTVELPFEQAEAVVMTLPQLLTNALRQKTGNQDARYVLGLHAWAIEGVKDQQCLIATLKTTDGFEVCFGIPFEAGRIFGWNQQRIADGALDTAPAGSAVAGSAPPAKLN